MSSEERKQILQMVESGKITAEQAMTLIRELDDEQAQAAPALPVMEEGPAEPDPGLENTAERVRGLWRIPLGIGVALTVLAAMGIYAAMTSAASRASGGYNFWFYCLWAPFLAGVALMALSAWSRTSRWLFVKVDRTRSADGPRNIMLGFPLPLNLAGWFLRTFGSRIQGLRNTNADEIINAVSMTGSDNGPLIVNVDDSDDGERVQVFIG